MNKTTILSLINDKANEMTSNLKALLDNPELSENTKRTQKFQRQTTIHNLLVLRAVVEQAGDEINFPGDTEKWFNSMVTLTETRKATKVVVGKGDKLVDLLHKYKDVKDVYAKIMKAATEAGLSLNIDHFE